MKNLFFLLCIFVVNPILSECINIVFEGPEIDKEIRTHKQSSFIEVSTTSYGRCRLLSLYDDLMTWKQAPEACDGGMIISRDPLKLIVVLPYEAKVHVSIGRITRKFKIKNNHKYKLSLDDKNDICVKREALKTKF